MALTIKITNLNGVQKTVDAAQFFHALSKANAANNSVIIQGEQFNLDSAEFFGTHANLYNILGDIDCSVTPDYPAGTTGDVWRANPAGAGAKIGGVNGKDVVVDDLIICFATNAGGDEAAVGASWVVTGVEDLTSATPAALAALIATNGLNAGKRYLDTTNNILLTAANENTFETVAYRKFSLPDHQQLNGANLGIFNTGLAPNIGDFVIWGNQMWRNTSGVCGISTSDFALDGNWVIDNTRNLSAWMKVVHYTEAANPADWTSLSVWDNHGNCIQNSYDAIVALGYNPIDRFQFGRTGTWDCRVTDGALNNMNAIVPTYDVWISFSVVTVNDNAQCDGADFDSSIGITLSGSDDFTNAELFHVTAFSTDGQVTANNCSLKYSTFAIAGISSLVNAKIDYCSVSLTNLCTNPMFYISLADSAISQSTIILSRNIVASGNKLDLSNLVCDNSSITVDSTGGLVMEYITSKNSTVSITDSYFNGGMLVGMSNYSYSTFINSIGVNFITQKVNAQNMYIENTTVAVDDGGNLNGIYTGMRLIGSDLSLAGQVSLSKVISINSTISFSPVGAIMLTCDLSKYEGANVLIATDQVDNSGNEFTNCTVSVNGIGSSMNGCKIGSGFTVNIGENIIYRYKTAMPGFSNFDVVLPFKVLTTIKSPVSVIPFAVGDVVTNGTTGLTGTIISYQFWGFGDATIIMKDATGMWSSADAITAPSGAASTVAGGTTGVYSGAVISIPHDAPTFPYQVGEDITEGTTAAVAQVIADNGTVLIMANPTGLFANGHTLTGSISGGVSNSTNNATYSTIDLTGYEYCGKIIVDSVNANDIVETVNPMIPTYDGVSKIIKAKSPLKLNFYDKSAGGISNIKTASASPNTLANGAKNGFVELLQDYPYQLVTPRSAESFS